MKFFIALVILVSGSQVFARSQAFFGLGGNNVRIIIQGSQNDRDVSRLFSIMNASEMDGGNSLRKTVSYRDHDGVEALNINCGISKMIPDLGSCTVTLNKAAGMSFQPAEKSASYVVTDRGEARRLAEFFNIPAGTRDFYISNDVRFKMYYVNDDRIEFGILYKGDGL